jgi:hypothetical protein
MKEGMSWESTTVQLWVSVERFAGSGQRGAKEINGHRDQSV